jgi:glycosyltransferase involved in cell wall biosynthesis
MSLGICYPKPSMAGFRKLLFVVVKHTRSLGASEDLVVAAAAELATRGRPPAFWFNFCPPESDGRIKRLRAAGCRIHFHDARSPLLRVCRRLSRSADRRALESSLVAALQAELPDRVILNQGGNSDASVEAPMLQRAGVPYAVLCHSATESSWPGPEFLPAMRAIYTGASHRLFVSKAILQLTEAQLGLTLDQVFVVYNPCKLSAIQISQWPYTNTGFSLAAVSRLENRQKGHDLILRTLALPQWRERPLAITFYGEGPHRQTLESYAAALDLTSVSFAGHVDDIQAIWRQHHGFIQASRYEGYGLSLVEAMFCERMVVTTPIPAAKEFVTEGETGFFARAASVEEVNDALDRAWSKRDIWREMGFAACRRVSEGYPKQPIEDFLGLLQKLN